MTIEPEGHPSRPTPPALLADLAVWRSTLGKAAARWGRSVHEVTDTYWVAMSGQRDVSFNTACIYGRDGVPVSEQIIEDAARTKLPLTVYLAGEGLGAARVLTESGFVCVRSVPMMIIDLSIPVDPPTPLGRLIPESDLTAAQKVVAEGFGLPDEVAAIAVPSTEGFFGLYDGGELVCLAGTSSEGKVSGGWSMATPPRLQRSGYGALLLRDLKLHLATNGQTALVFIASEAGLKVYFGAGGRIVEFWQMWAPRRWALL